MADRFYGYQYDTNPRKLNYDYTQYRKNYPQKEEPVKTTNRKRSNNNKNNTAQNKRTNKVQQEIQEKNLHNRRKQVVKHNKIENDSNTTKVSKTSIKARLKLVMFLIAGFSVLFAISYQNSLISESFNKKEQLKKEMEALSKTNQQIEVNIENNLNLNHIEQAAKEKIGMQKLSNGQKIYVNLPKEDYVAPASEQVVIEEDTNFFQKLINGFIKTVK